MSCVSRTISEYDCLPKKAPTFRILPSNNGLGKTTRSQHVAAGPATQSIRGMLEALYHDFCARTVTTRVAEPRATTVWPRGLDLQGSMTFPTLRLCGIAVPVASNPALCEGRVCFQAILAAWHVAN